MKPKTQSVRIRSEVWESLRREAEKMGRTISGQLEWIIKKYIGKAGLAGGGG
jgi:predicted DNA-binding protein